MIAQLTVRSRGKVLRAEERDQDLFTAIDLVAEKMQRQITRFRIACTAAGRCAARKQCACRKRLRLWWKRRW
jgi:ribosome-associated translation inhibitor RaiA